MKLLLFLFSIVLFTTVYCQNSNTLQKGTRTIYLIRHGEYDQTDERDAFTGRELTPLGIAQARLLASRLKSMSVEFSSLTSSTMTRAIQTALIINQKFPELDLRLRMTTSKTDLANLNLDIVLSREVVDHKYQSDFICHEKYYPVCSREFYQISCI